MSAADVTQLSKTEVNFYSLLIEIKAKYNGEKCKNQLLIAIAWEQDYWNQVLQINLYLYRELENKSKGRHTVMPK